MPVLAITPDKAKKLISLNEIDFFVDVRSPEEFKEENPSQTLDGHKVINLPYNELILLERWSREHSNKEKTVLIFCKKGKRASFASKIVDGSGSWGRILYVYPGGWTELV
jgi:rhodanese-related sulfurtransferase